MEIWKPIILKYKYKNYEVSSRGRIRNCKTNKILKPFKSNKHSKLLYVGLSRKSETCTFAVHKLVATHFDRMELKDETAYHINFIQNDNRDLNLMGCSKGAAIARTRRHNNKRKYRGIHKFAYNKTKKWRALLCIGKMKVKTIGYYKTRNEAFIAYQKAYKSYYQEKVIF